MLQSAQVSMCNVSLHLSDTLPVSAFSALYTKAIVNHSKSKRYCPTFAFRSFMTLAFKFRSMIQVKLLFLCIK